MIDLLKYLGMVLTGAVGMLGVILDFHVKSGGTQVLTRAGVLAVGIFWSGPPF